MAGVILGLLASCAGSRHYHALPAEGPPPAPRYLELNRPVQEATLRVDSSSAVQTYSSAVESFLSDLEAWLNTSKPPLTKP